jgi:hypothetical protein
VHPMLPLVNVLLDLLACCRDNREVRAVRRGLARLRRRIQRAAPTHLTRVGTQRPT